MCCVAVAKIMTTRIEMYVVKFSLGISNLVICCCSLSFVCILEVCLFICGQQTLPKTSRLRHTLSHVAQNLGFYQAAVQCMIVLSGKYPRFVFFAVA